MRSLELADVIHVVQHYYRRGAVDAYAADRTIQQASTETSFEACFLFARIDGLRAPGEEEASRERRERLLNSCGGRFLIERSKYGKRRSAVQFNGRFKAAHRRRRRKSHFSSRPAAQARLRSSHAPKGKITVRSVQFARCRRRRASRRSRRSIRGRRSRICPPSAASTFPKDYYRMVSGSGSFGNWAALKRRL